MEKKNAGKFIAKEATAAVAEKKQRVQQLVKELAYSLYEKRGYAHGLEMQDWLEAENTMDKR